MADETTRFYALSKEEMARLIAGQMTQPRVSVENDSIVAKSPTTNATIRDHRLPPHLQQRLGRQNGCAVRYKSGGGLRGVKKWLDAVDEEAGLGGGKYKNAKGAQEILAALEQYEI